VCFGWCKYLCAAQRGVLGQCDLLEDNMYVRDCVIIFGDYDVCM
jgi:hypothetical protein